MTCTRGFARIGFQLFVVMLLFENQGRFTNVGRLLSFANGRFRVAKN